MKPLVSVVVTAHNHGPYIGPALESVLAQTYPNTELIVVDDGSNDSTADIAASFIPRVRLLRRRGLGVAGARNAGVRAARGELIALLDGDDIWEPEKLAIQVEAAIINPQAGLIAVDGVEFDENGIRRPSLFSDRVRRLLAGAAPLGSRVRHLRYVNLSDAKARNADLRTGTRASVAPLDSDDTSRVARRASEVEGSGGPRCKQVCHDSAEPLAVTAPGYRLLLHGNPISTTSQVMIPKQVFEVIGLSDTRFRVASDYDLYLRIASRFDMTLINAPLTRWRYHPTSASGPEDRRPLIWAADVVRVWVKHRRQAPPEYRLLLQEHINRTLYTSAQRAYYYGLTGHRTWATRYLVGLLRRHPSFLPLLAFLGGLWCPPLLVRAFGRSVRQAIQTEGMRSHGS